MIPQEQSAAVTRGLREAFGLTEFEDIQPLTKGHTPSLVFRIVVGGSPYMLKIILLNYDLTRHFSCIKTAAEAGLAPHVWYTNIPDRIVITDFVEAVPFPASDALVRIPALLRSLHALPPFPEVPHYINNSCMFLVHDGPARDGFLQKFRAANVLPEDQCAEVLARCAQVAAAYPRHDLEMVSSHNDVFKPDNILFDGSRVWLVDWEAAFLNDRYADLAVIANLVVTNDGEERIYLQAYFGQPPDEYQLARFFLMRQVAHIFYAVAFLFLGSSGRRLDLAVPAPDFQDFHRRMWSGEVNLSDMDTKVAYGRVHWEQLLRNMRQPRFNEAVKIVSERYACP